MQSTTSDEERAQFTERLISAVVAAGYEPAATALARAFNAHINTPLITAHAVRRWLLGTGIPTQGNIQVLAHFLNVNAEWLRFGESGNPLQWSSSSGDVTSVSREVAMIVIDFKMLDVESKQLFKKTLAALLERQIAVNISRASSRLQSQQDRAEEPLLPNMNSGRVGASQVVDKGRRVGSGLD